MDQPPSVWVLLSVSIWTLSLRDRQAACVLLDPLPARPWVKGKALFDPKGEFMALSITRCGKTRNVSF